MCVDLKVEAGRAPRLLVLFSVVLLYNLYCTTVYIAFKIPCKDLLSKVVGGKVGKREWRYLHSLLHQLGLLQMFLVVFITRVFVALSLWSPKSVPKNNHKEMSQKIVKKRVPKSFLKRCSKK